MPFLFDTIMFSITYIWCSLNSEGCVPVFAGFQCKVSRLPWYLLLGHLLLFYSVIGEAAGIMIGWIYFYFKFQITEKYQKKLFPDAPNFLNNFFNQSKYVWRRNFRAYIFISVYFTLHIIYLSDYCSNFQPLDVDRDSSFKNSFSKL